MLHSIRSRIKSVLVFLLFGLLIASFLLWGIEGFRLGNSGEPPVASVGPVEIDRYAFLDSYQREIENLRRRLSANFDSEQARALGLDRLVLAREIRQALLSLEANDLGIAISDRLVAETIKKSPQFTDEVTGQFDPGRFQSYLQIQGISEAAQANQLRHEIARNLYMGSLSAASTAPRALTMALLSYRGERRSGEFVAIPPAAVGPIATADDATLTAYLEENQAAFMDPEYRRLSYLSLQALDLAPTIEVAEDLLVETYEARREEFNSPELRNVQQMVFDDQETADQAAKRLADGEDFAAVAKDLLDLESEDLALGALSKDELIGELGEIAFATPLGQISPPVQSPLGWHLVKVTAIEPAIERGLEDVRAELRHSLALELAEDVLYEMGAQLADLLGGGASLEEAAQDLDLALVTIDAIDAQGRDMDGNAVTNQIPSPLFLETAFGLTESEVSTLIDAGDDGYFVIRIEQITDSALPPLERIRDRVVEAWTKRQRETAVLEKAKQLQGQAKDGTPFDVLAAQVGQLAQKISRVTRDGDGLNQDLPPALVGALFRVKPGESTTTYADETAYLVRVNSAEPPGPAAKEKALQTTQEQIEQSLAEDLIQQLISALESKHEVIVNQSVLDSVL